MAMAEVETPPFTTRGKKQPEKVEEDWSWELSVVFGVNGPEILLSQ